jgi:hypothetical protein
LFAFAEAVPAVSRQINMFYTVIRREADEAKAGRRSSDASPGYVKD